MLIDNEEDFHLMSTYIECEERNANKAGLLNLINDAITIQNARKTTVVGMALPRMSTSLSLALVTWLFLMVASLGPIFAHSEPDPMARPTRPKVFTSVEELRRYLDLVRDYYSLNGKARYGKRAQILPQLPVEYSLDVSQMLFTLGQQSQQAKQEKQENGRRQQEKLREKFKDSQLADFQQPAVGAQQSHFYDIIAKYYAEMQ